MEKHKFVAEAWKCSCGAKTVINLNRDRFK